MDPKIRKILTVVISTITVIILVLTSVSVTKALAFGWGSISKSNEEKGDDYETRYQRLDQIYNLLMEQYYEDVDSETLIQGAIDGMMASLGDPYTFYFTPEEMSSTNSSRSGNYVGIGVQVVRTEDNYIKVTRVFYDSSAMEAGLKKNDIIYSTDGIILRPTNDTELTEAVAKIKDGEIGSYANIEILRDGEIIPVTVERTAVTQNRVEYSILEGDIGYILLYDFFGSAVDGVERALNEFKEKDVKGIIFDVRDNPGGSLDYCIKITDYFVDGGIIVYTMDRQGERIDYGATEGSVDLPLVVLVNGNSASASEIFAAAIQEAGAGIIIGETTFGKGIVQTLWQFPGDGAGAQITTSAYYTPSGKSIHKIGVVPDIEVGDIETTDEEHDAQLEKALEVLREQTGYE